MENQDSKSFLFNLKEIMSNSIISFCDISKINKKKEFNSEKPKLKLISMNCEIKNILIKEISDSNNET